MLDLPLNTIIDKIAAATKKSQEDIKTRIKRKLEDLSGLISEAGAAHIVANELGVRLEEAPSGPLTIDKITPGLKNIQTVGKVRQVYEVREFSNERRSGKVGNFLLTDTTGTTRVVLWNEQADRLKELEAGDVIKIKGAYTRSNNDRVELHLGSEAKLYKNPEGVEVDVDITQTTRPEAENKKIADLSAQDQNVTVQATIVQVFDPRFFAVCPTCNARVGEDGTCAAHGKVTPTYNYVMNLYLDDSTDNVRCVLWREQIESLLGKGREALLALKDQPAGFEDDKNELLGRIVKVRGRVNNNEQFGRLELVAYEVHKETDQEAEAADLKREADKKKPEITTKEEVTATMDDGKVERITTKQETSISEDDGEEVFSLEDIEDLEDLD